MRLSRKFEGFYRRRLKGDDQDRDADRTMSLGDAAWLAGMILSGHTESFPHVVSWTGAFPTNEQITTMQLSAAQEILFGLGTYETMRRCHERAYSNGPGRDRKSLTLADVRDKWVGNAAEGGDERYERRLRKRAKEDEIATEIAGEWGQAMRALEARSRG